MKISELISTLTLIKEEHGEAECIIEVPADNRQGFKIVSVDEASLEYRAKWGNSVMFLGAEID